MIAKRPCAKTGVERAGQEAGAYGDFNPFVLTTLVRTQETEDDNMSKSVFESGINGTSGSVSQSNSSGSAGPDVLANLRPNLNTPKGSVKEMLPGKNTSVAKAGQRGAKATAKRRGRSGRSSDVSKELIGQFAESLGQQDNLREQIRELKSQAAKPKVPDWRADFNVVKDELYVKRSKAPHSMLFKKSFTSRVVGVIDSGVRSWLGDGGSIDPVCLDPWFPVWCKTGAIFNGPEPIKVCELPIIQGFNNYASRLAQYSFGAAVAAAGPTLFGVGWTALVNLFSAYVPSYFFPDCVTRCASFFNRVLFVNLMPYKFICYLAALVHIVNLMKLLYEEVCEPIQSKELVLLPLNEYTFEADPVPSMDAEEFVPLQTVVLCQSAVMTTLSDGRHVYETNCPSDVSREWCEAERTWLRQPHLKKLAISSGLLPELINRKTLIANLKPKDAIQRLVRFAETVALCPEQYGELFTTLSSTTRDTVLFSACHVLGRADLPIRDFC